MERREFIRKSALAALAGVAMGIPVLGCAVSGSGETKDEIKTKTNDKKMKILVLTGSPRRNGNSNYLADRFIAGAQEAGHEVVRFDSAVHKLDGCMACNRCGMNGDCVLKDDFDIVRPHIIDADMVVFVSPMYYFGISSQLKRVIDRFYAINGKIKGVRKKAAFMLTYADTEPKEAEPMLVHYRTLVEYLGWEDCGTVVARGVWTAGAVRNTQYPQQAYELGRSL